MTQNEFENLKIGEFIKNPSGNIWKIIEKDKVHNIYKIKNNNYITSDNAFAASFWEKVTDLDKIKFL